MVHIHMLDMNSQDVDKLFNMLDIDGEVSEAVKDNKWRKKGDLVNTKSQCWRALRK